MKWRSVSLFFLLPLFLSCENKSLPLQLHAANYGSYGVLRLKVASNDYVEQTGKPFPLYPGIPGIRGDLSGPSGFRFSPGGFPSGKQDVVWKLAKLKNCKRVVEASRSYSKQYPGIYTRKSGCEWQPIEGKVITKTIDFDELRQRPEFARHGKKHSGFIPGFISYYGSTIFFVFRDEELDVHLGSYVTNPMR